MSITPHPTKNRKLPPDWKGKRWWQVIYYPEGRKGGKATLLYEGTETEARAYERDLRLSARKSPLAVNPQFERIIPDFLEWYATESAPRTVESTALHLRHLQAVFGKYPLTAITGGGIEQYKRKRLSDGVKPITINKELNGLSVLLKWAKKENLIGEMGRVELFPGKMTRSPVPIMPTAQELEALVMAVRPEVRGIAMLEFYAGLRRNEAHQLRAEDVLLERGLLIITGKGGKQRVVPINHPALVEELKRRSDEVGTGYLWVNPVTGRPFRNITEAIKAAARRVGLKGRIYNHLLRHGFGTTAIESGIDLRTVQGLMGHSSSRVTEIYTHLAATHLIKQMEKFRVDTVSTEKADNLPKEKGK